MVPHVTQKPCYLFQRIVCNDFQPPVRFVCLTITKWTFSLFLIFLAKEIVVSQNLALENQLPGIYHYAAPHYMEQLQLMENGRFVSVIKTEFLALKTAGNWQFRNDSIILDSQPQKDKLIVLEAKKRNRNNLFTVTDKNGDNIIYRLVLTLKNGDTVILKDQFKRSRFKGDVQSFRIIDSKGLESPEYRVKGQGSNFFTIFFETSRVFENEGWYIENGEITPRRFDGKEQKFKLVKRNDGKPKGD